jgi:glycosyltransferase involved in cell wall biosynthesis
MRRITKNLGNFSTGRLDGASLMKIVMFGVKGMPCPAGAEKVAEYLAIRLVKQGHEVTVFVRPHYTPLEVTEYQGVRLVHLPSIPTKNLDAITHSFAATLATLRRRPDIAHIHGIGNSIFAPILRAAGIKVVVQSHGLDWQRAKWSKFAQAYLKLADYCAVCLPDATTVVSHKLKEYYESRYKRRVYYIPNGINPVCNEPPDEILKLGLKGNDYILFAARLVPEKGCHYLIDAYQRLEGCSKKLVIAGDTVFDDPYGQKLKIFASQDIIFTGFASGKLFQELLSNAYIFVLPSEIEGLSTGLLEAMGYSNCVLVSDIQENLEVIGDGGMSFRTKDVSDLQMKLETLMTHPNLVNTYREKARTSILERYDWDKIVDQYIELYQTLLA